jgi:hypothetical protein
MVNVGIGAPQQPVPLARVSRKILHHVFMDFFLQVDSQGAVRADDFISANARIRGDISAGIRNSHVGRNVSDGVVRAFDRSRDEFLQKLLLRSGNVGFFLS